MKQSERSENGKESAMRKNRRQEDMGGRAEKENHIKEGREKWRDKRVVEGEEEEEERKR